jgi:hypothetical protein
MHTRSSPPQSVSGDTTAISAGKPRCDWSEEDETELVNFLLDRQAEAGDSATFKPAVWNAAALHLEQFRTKGGPKTANSCSSKWNRVRGVAGDTDYPLTTVLAQGEL